MISGDADTHVTISYGNLFRADSDESVDRTNAGLGAGLTEVVSHATRPSSSGTCLPLLSVVNCCVGGEPVQVLLVENTPPGGHLFAARSSANSFERCRSPRASLDADDTRAEHQHIPVVVLNKFGVPNTFHGRSRLEPLESGSQPSTPQPRSHKAGCRAQPGSHARCDPEHSLNNPPTRCYECPGRARDALRSRKPSPPQWRIRHDQNLWRRASLTRQSAVSRLL